MRSAIECDNCDGTGIVKDSAPLNMELFIVKGEHVVHEDSVMYATHELSQDTLRKFRQNDAKCKIYKDTIVYDSQTKQSVLLTKIYRMPLNNNNFPEDNIFYNVKLKKVMRITDKKDLDGRILVEKTGVKYYQNWAPALKKQKEKFLLQQVKI